MTTTPEKPTLLIVEDNAVISTMLQKTVKRRRGSTVDVLSASNGKEGVELAQRTKPDLVLLDWMMPEYNGQYFLSEQSRNPDIADVPVFVYTVVEEDELQAVLKKYPAVKQLIHKPVSPTRIYDIITPYLKRRAWTPGSTQASSSEPQASGSPPA